MGWLPGCLTPENGVRFYPLHQPGSLFFPVFRCFSKSPPPAKSNLKVARLPPYSGLGAQNVLPPNPSLLLCPSLSQVWARRASYPNPSLLLCPPSGLGPQGILPEDLGKEAVAAFRANTLQRNTALEAAAAADDKAAINDYGEDIGRGGRAAPCAVRHYSSQYSEDADLQVSARGEAEVAGCSSGGKTESTANDTTGFSNGGKTESTMYDTAGHTSDGRADHPSDGRAELASDGRAEHVVLDLAPQTTGRGAGCEGDPPAEVSDYKWGASWLDQVRACA